MRSARRWIRAIGILVLVGAAAFFALSFGETTSVGSSDDAVKIGNNYVDASSIRGVAIGLAVFGVLLVVVVRLAKGRRTTLMFGVGATLCLLLAAANLLGGSPISAVIPGIAGVRGFQAWRMARTLKFD